MGRVILQQLR